MKAFDVALLLPVLFHQRHTQTHQLAPATALAGLGNGGLLQVAALNAPLELHENVDYTLAALKLAFCQLVPNSAFVSAAELIVAQLLKFLLHFAFYYQPEILIQIGVQLVSQDFLCIAKHYLQFTSLLLEVLYSALLVPDKKLG